MGCSRNLFQRDEQIAPGLSARSLSKQEQTQNQSFTQIDAEQSGIDFENILTRKNDRKYLYNGSGVAVGDYDADGLPDLYFTSIDGPSRLYRQRRPFVFEDVSEKSGTLVEDTWSAGASFVDFDNDGDLDLYVCNLGKPNHLFRNEGKGRFKDVAAEIGLAHRGASVMAAFADADRDGDLDMYLLTNRLFAAGEEAANAKLRFVGNVPTVHPDFVEHYGILEGHFIETGQTDRFFINDGKGKFTDATESSGISGYDMGLSVTWWDFDNDGWPDIYVANDMMGPDHLYRNQGDGTFKDVAAERLPHTSWFSMGADAADVNNDGRMDFISGDMSATNHFKQKTTMGPMSNSRWFLESAVPRQYMRNAFLINTGTHRFMEAAHMAGLASTNWTWAMRFGDLDADGWVDLFVTNGHSRNANQSDFEARVKALLAQKKREEARQLGMKIPPLPERNLAFRNAGELRFENVSSAWGLDAMGVSHGAAMVDLDRDGDLDLVVNNLNQKASLYRNDLAGGQQLLITLRGKTSNHFGIGARVELITNAGLQVREMHLAHGYLSADEPIVHFGVGEHDLIKELRVSWPSGQEQTFSDLRTNKFYTVTEPAGSADKVQSVNKAQAMFEPIALGDVGISFRHRERSYDDYEREPLLPERLSQKGPGLAVVDLDGDERDDVVIGGAAGQAGAVFLQQEPYRFTELKGLWQQNTAFEDQAVLVFDANADGKRDLFWVSGGVEAKPGEAVLRDRFFISSGSKLAFRATQAAKLPTASGGPAALADIDRDGDLDLFIGGASVPGAYPEAEPSMLWMWERGAFRNKTALHASQISDLGIVRGARFTDLDDDGWIDLVVATEWGPLHYFRNKAGKLVDRTKDAGLSVYTGMWNGVEAGDVDADGDIDLIATNRGLNTKYHASKEHPMTLYVKDFDGNGRVDLVEVDLEEGTQYPTRGLSCSSSAMPDIKEEFPSYDEFARASLEDVYGAEELKSAKRYTATHLAHTLFINDGKGRFTMRELPRMSQISEGFGLAVQDFDADGYLDVFMAHNSFAPQPETGRYDGGLSALLLGKGEGNFEWVDPEYSGIVIPEDAKGVAVGDIDADGAPDLIVSINNGKPQIYRNRLKSSRFFRLVLQGNAGNKSAVGARATLTTKKGLRMLRELSAGGGYRSQSSSTLWFGIPANDAPALLNIRWPGGHTSTHTLEEAANSLRLSELKS